MATKKSPVQTMKEKFQEKESLVDRVLGVLSSDEDRDALKKKLLAVSNRKLLRLLEVGSEMKSKYGSPEKLAEAVAAAMGKAKDQAFVGKIAAQAKRTPARVLDLLASATARTRKDKSAGARA